MSHVVVFNSYAKTVRIATTPVKYLTEVRDEACQKFGISNDNFTLKYVQELIVGNKADLFRYNNKPISLSQQIRLANLPQGARLELVQASRSPTVISVALQLPASRLVEKFASNTSLWEILRHFESGKGNNYNFTQRGVPEMSGSSGTGRLNYETPVLTVMPGHREHSGLANLQQTLSQLGFDSGSALLKLSFKNSGMPLEEAMAQISQFFKTEEFAATTAVGTEGVHEATATQATSVPNIKRTAPEATTTVAGETIRSEEPAPEPMEVDDDPLALQAGVHEQPATVPTTENFGDTSPAATIRGAATTATPLQEAAPISSSESSQRTVQIFSAPTSSTPQAVRNSSFNISDYLPTIEHAKAHQVSLQNKTRNQRLPSDKELEEQEKERQGKIAAAAARGGAVRVRLPDQNIIQMSFTKDDTAEIIYDQVKNYLDKKDEPFDLKYTGPTGRLVLIKKDNKRLIQDLRFSSNELITFQWAETASAAVRASRQTLASEWQEKAQALTVEAPIQEEEKKPQASSSVGQSLADGKRKQMNSEDKESKLKNILGKGLFKKK